MEGKIDEEPFVIWPVYEVVKFRCPKCEGIRCFDASNKWNVKAAR